MTTPSRIKVYVQPRASKNCRRRHARATSCAFAAAPPVDNAANEALVRLLAERLGIAKRRVRVAAGASSRHKIVEIDGVSAVAAISALLA
jgi:uncharacterized protein YggU (UPF0235/DUF167 family)